MFTNAIEELINFTRPIHTITRNYKEETISPGAATLFFVNENGVAITCKHVADFIVQEHSINQNYKEFKIKKNSIGKNNKFNQRVKLLEDEHNLKISNIAQLKVVFIGVTSQLNFTYRIINHPIYDLSIIIFENHNSPLYTSYAKFAKKSSTLKQGKFLCRLGFPFPEFDNFKLNRDTDDIEWTSIGNTNSPIFPIEGMMTRSLVNGNELCGVEISTPGLKGQSGGPLFDQNGIIYGMQANTSHLHLGFDMKNFEYNSLGKNIRINNQPFLHVGHCVHVDIIKDFLSKNNIKFYEED